MSFERIEAAINAGGFRGAFKYVGTKGIHRNQWVWRVEVEGEIWRVPVSSGKEIIVARTAYPEEG